MMLGDLVTGPRAQIIDTWAAEQTYLALGTMLAVAASLHIDACPMEGFSPNTYDEILGLPAKGLHAVALCTLGYRAEDDATASYAKVRLEEQDVIVHI